MKVESTHESMNKKKKNQWFEVYSAKIAIWLRTIGESTFLPSDLVL